MVIWSIRWTKSGMKYLILLVGLCQLTSSLEFKYHSNEDLTNYLTNMSTMYPDLTHMYSIGKSVQDRDLWVIAIGNRPRDHVTLRPHVKYIGNMHGNEVISREVLIHLIDYYLSNYNTNTTIKTFLDNTVVHIMPSMNPDGFAVSVEEDCGGDTGRYNANNFDLNRNFPGYFEVNTQTIQPETQAVMDWLKQYRFILSANLHGGAMVANYPFDNYVNASSIGSVRYATSPDDETFRFLSKVYSYSHSNMYTGLHCGDRFSEGITNGAWWYPVLGGMQDYNYIREGCMEITLEVSCCKYPNHTELPKFWTENKDALVNLLKEVHIGVKGLVLLNNTIVPNATMRIKGREMVPFRSSDRGEYWRLLLPGPHTIQVMSGQDVIAEKHVVLTGKDVVRQDIYIGDVNGAGVIQSYLPLTLSLMTLIFVMML